MYMEFRASIPGEPSSIKLFYLALSAAPLFVLINTNNTAAEFSGLLLKPRNIYRDQFVFLPCSEPICV